MQRSTTRGLKTGLGLVVLLGFGCEGCDPKTTDPEEEAEYEVKLVSDKTEVKADSSDSATLTIAVTVTGDGDRPRSATLTAISPGSLFPANATGGADGGTRTGETTLNVSLAGGKGSALLRCLDADQKPRAGNLTVTASIKVGDESVSSTPVRISCKPVPDNSKVMFTAPAEGSTVTAADRQEVTVSVRDFDDSMLNRQGAVVVATTASYVQMAPTPEAAPTVAGQPITLDVRNGVATFYVVYPGDNRTLAGPLTMTFTATFVSSLGTSREGKLTFLYGKAPNNSEIRFLGAAPMQDGDSNVFVASTSPLTVDMTAGQSSGDSNAIRLQVEIKNRGGQPPPAGSRVRFMCTPVDSGGQVNQANCNGFRAYPNSADPDAGEVQEESGLASGWVFSSIQDADGAHGRRGVAEVVFQPSGSSTPGEVRISAAFTPENSPEISVSEGDRTVVKLVDATSLSASITVTPEMIDSSLGQTALISVKVRKGTSVATDRAVCWTLNAMSAAKARLNVDGFTGNVSGTAVVRTNGEGISQGTVTPVNSNVRGTVDIRITVAGTDGYQGDTCPVDINNKSLVATVDITRPSILQGMEFVSAEPPVLGVVGSGMPSTSTVTFRLWNDEGEPEPQQPVTFVLESNGDALATVMPLATTDSSGMVVTFVSAGQQAAALVVRATASRGAEVVSASSDPIAVVGGKPAWSPLHIGVAESYRVWAPQAVAGYEDPFGPQARPEPTLVRLQLVDRFSNRVTRPYKIQWRSETGSIPAETYTDSNGFAEVEYVPGPAYTADTVPLPAELREIGMYRTSHQDAPQAVYRVGNPRDGRISILAATRGEESFQDSNGDGAFQRAYADINGNGRYDGAQEDCKPCTDLDCTRIANVPVASSVYETNRHLVEAFADLPEPFVDKNGDGLRANCDADLTVLPVHHDAYLWAAGIGTYCNPHFAEEPSGGPTGQSIFKSNAADAKDLAWCRAHWCPDWEPAWSCSDSLPAEVPNVEGRTPEAIFATPGHYASPNPSSEIIVGGRILWCPEWRYRDLVSPTDGQPIPRDARAGWVGHPGIRGLMVPDDMLPGTHVVLRYRMGAQGGEMCMEVRPANVCGAGGRWTPVAASNHLVPAFRVFSGDANRNTEFVYVSTEPGELGVMEWSLEFKVALGDQRAPFSWFDQEHLRVLQTDQFIDGNNNNVWDDANSCYDTDTLIYKQLELIGTGDIAFTNGLDWSEAPPRIFGMLVQQGTGNDKARMGWDLFETNRILRTADPPTGLFDRMLSFIHIRPNIPAPGVLDEYPDTVSTTFHTGGGDLINMLAGESTVLAIRLVDVNGNWVSPYDTGMLTLTWTGKPEPPNTMAGPSRELLSFPMMWTAGAKATDNIGHDGIIRIGLHSTPTTNPVYICENGAADAGSATCKQAPPASFELTVKYEYDPRTGESGKIVREFPLTIIFYSNYP